jgi:hypothetical protein
VLARPAGQCPRRTAPLPLTPPAHSRCTPGTVVTQSRLLTARTSVSRAPPPSPVTRQWCHLSARGRCQPPELSLPSTGPPLSSPFPPSTRRRPWTPCPLFLSIAPPSHHKRRRLPPVPLFTLSSHSCPCTTPPPSLPPPLCPCPLSTTERLRTALSPAFIGERLPELQSIATNGPLLTALLLEAAGACHGHQ